MISLKVAFIIRFHYKKDDERFDWRFKFFKEEVLPRINSQSFKGFDICVWCNPWHKELFEGLGVKTFEAVDKTRYKYFDKKDIYYFHDFVDFEETTGLDKYDVQVGLDSDDFISKDFLQLAMDKVNKHVSENPNESLHLCFQPEYYYVQSGEVKPMKTYNTKKGSAFMVLYQPINDNYRFIYSESHMSIITRTDKSEVLPVGHCWACVHDLNESTGR